MSYLEYFEEYFFLIILIILIFSTLDCETADCDHHRGRAERLHLRLPRHLQLSRAAERGGGEPVVSVLTSCLHPV